MTHRFRFQGQRGVVTGAGSGIGQATVRRLAEEGATVLGLDLCEEALKQTRNGYEEMVTVRALDVRSLGVAEVLDEFGQVDVLVNAAGILRRHELLEHSVSAWSETLDINLKSVFRLSREFARAHINSGVGGAIVNVSSIEAFTAAPRHAAYTASKAGVMMLTRAFALELAEHGIRVNAVAPGVTETAMNAELREDLARAKRLLEPIPMGRFGRPEEQAAAIAFLASEEASYITGEILAVDGGWLTA